MILVAIRIHVGAFALHGRAVIRAGLHSERRASRAIVVVRKTIVRMYGIRTAIFQARFISGTDVFRDRTQITASQACRRFSRFGRDTSGARTCITTIRVRSFVVTESNCKIRRTIPCPFRSADVVRIKHGSRRNTIRRRTVRARATRSGNDLFPIAVDHRGT